MHTDGGGFMLIGMKSSPVTWNVPFNGQTVDPYGPPHWSSKFGSFEVLDFAVQISTNKNFEREHIGMIQTIICCARMYLNAMSIGLL